MKTLISSIVLAATVATGAMATQSVVDLTNDEQAAVRLGECRAIWNAAGSRVRNSNNDFRKLYPALTRKGQKFAYGTQLEIIMVASRVDTEVAIVLDEIKPTEAEVVKCIDDAKAIARDDYKPNFTKPEVAPEVMPEPAPAEVPVEAPDVDYLTNDDINNNLGKTATEVQRKTFYDANKGKKVVYTGKVVSVDGTSWLSGPTVGIAIDRKTKVAVNCKFPKDSDASVAHINKGDTFTCEGTLGNYVFLLGGASVSINAK